MIKLTNAEIVGLHRAIQGLKTSKAQLPIKLWFAINKNEKTLAEHVKNFEEARIELAQRHTEKYTKDGKTYKKGDFVINEDGSYKLIDPKAFTEEFNILVGTTIDIDIQKVSIDDCSNLEVSGEDNPFMGSFVEHCIEGL